MTNKYKISCS